MDEVDLLQDVVNVYVTVERDIAATKAPTRDRAWQVGAPSARVAVLVDYNRVRDVQGGHAADAAARRRAFVAVSIRARRAVLLGGAVQPTLAATAARRQNVVPGRPAPAGDTNPIALPGRKRDGDFRSPAWSAIVVTGQLPASTGIEHGQRGVKVAPTGAQRNASR